MLNKCLHGLIFGELFETWSGHMPRSLVYDFDKDIFPHYTVNYVRYLLVMYTAIIFASYSADRTSPDSYKLLNSPSKFVLTSRNVCPRALWSDIAYPSFTANCFLVDAVKLTVTEKLYLYQFSVYVWNGDTLHRRDVYTSTLYPIHQPSVNVAVGRNLLSFESYWDTQIQPEKRAQ